MQTTAPAKPLLTRAWEARSRARTQQLRVYRIAEQQCYEAPSASHPGERHQLTRDRNGWACTCQGYRVTSFCHHLGALARRAEREGWQLRRIARSPEAARRYQA